jgi:hypothetical protein
MSSVVSAERFLSWSKMALVVLAAVVSCTFDPQGLGDAAVPDAGRLSSGGSAGRSPGGATATGGAGASDGSTPGATDAARVIDSSAPCLPGLAASACAPEGLSCTQDDPSRCQMVECHCVAAHWACAVTPYSCGDPCPPTGQVTCGGACTGAATGCLCRKVPGGADLEGCACRATTWSCP